MIDRRRTFTVEAADAGDRVDKCVAARLASEGVSRATVLRATEEGALCVNGRAVKASYRVREGDEVTIELPKPPPSEAIAEDIAIDVVFEDEAILVVNKPAGLVVHPARGHATGTLVNAVLFHHAIDDDAVEEEAPERPGIVHRLDRDTSGVMVIAKSAIARASLKQQFFEHSIERVYEAIVLGAIRAPVSFDTLYNRHPTDRIKFSSRVSRGRRACTHVTPIESLGLDATRIECRLETGRTHQIRVHLSDAGHPLLGDPLYGRRPKDTALRSVSESLGRQALHARVLAFNHPLSGQRVRFERPPPEDFAVALAALRGRCTA